MNLIKWPKNLYTIETLIFGDALNRALNPERIIIVMIMHKNLTDLYEISKII